MVTVMMTMAMVMVMVKGVRKMRKTASVMPRFIRYIRRIVLSELDAGIITVARRARLHMIVELAQVIRSSLRGRETSRVRELNCRIKRHSRH